jgi:hypothetical protein
MLAKTTGGNLWEVGVGERCKTWEKPSLVVTLERVLKNVTASQSRI